MSERLADLADEFARALRAEQRAPRTVELYLQSVVYFTRWLAEHDRPPTLNELTRSGIRGWLADLAAASQAPGTVRTRYRGMHRFTKYLVDEGDLAEDPMKGMSPPSAQPPPVPVLSDEQLGALLKDCAGDTFNNRRDEAIIRLLLDTGVRASELCSLTVVGTDRNTASAVIVGKGSKPRGIYWGSRTGRALDRYVKARRRHRFADHPALLLSQRGPLSADGMREIVKGRGRAVGLPDLHPHQFRHTFAHDFMAAGGDGRNLMRLAGWSSDSMLQVYGASMADQRAADAARNMRRGDRV